MKTQTYAASVMGREHLRLGRNNQDGVAHVNTEARQVLVVTDGCGSQRHSEVGAQLGARFLSQWLVNAEMTDELPEQAMHALCRALGDMAYALGGDSRTTVENYFLFTVLAACRVGSRVMVFGIGDGALCVDGSWQCLDSGPDNAPDYCAYRLTGRASTPRVYFDGAAQQVALASDGVQALLNETPSLLATLWAEAPRWRNPLTLQRRLNVWAEQHRLADDASLALLCERQEEAPCP